MADSNIQATRTKSWRMPVFIILIGVVLGLVLAGWALTKSDYARNWLLGSSASPEKAIAIPVPDAPAQLSPQPPALASAPPIVADDMAARLAQIESRMARVESTASTGHESARAEGLLIAFAARRALEKGMALGYIEGELTRQFGQSQPRAVAMIIAAARRPATIDALSTQLEALTPDLAGNKANESWWDGIKRGAASLIIVRQAGDASPDPAVRLNRAKQLISAGQVDQALAEVARLPNRAKADSWIATARRHIEADRALDLLEAAAILPQAPATPSTPVLAPESASPIAAPTLPAASDTL